MQAAPTGAELAAVRSEQAVGGRKSLMVVRVLLLWQWRHCRYAAGVPVALSCHDIPAGI
eukprot:COSAG02_NODE_56800_length_283_cov_1.402174_1_plen_58_part_10